MSEQMPPTPPGATVGASLPDQIASGWKSRSASERNWMMIGAIALLVVAIGTLLPWFSHPLGSSSGIRSAAGKLILLISVAALGYLAFSLSKSHLLAMAWLTLAAIGAGLTLWSIVLLIQVHRALNFSFSMGGEALRERVSVGSVGFGLYLMVIASLAVTAAFSVLVAPNLAKLQFGTVAKSLWIWLGVGAVVGLVMGLITGS